MVGRSSALEQLRRLGPLFRAKEAVAAGVSWRDLYALRDEGEITELSRGLFQLTEAVGAGNLDLLIVSARVPAGMVCLNSALAYWDLSDEIPSRVHVAVPEGAHRPVIKYPPTKVHVFNRQTFELGRIEVREERGEHFWVTDRERTIADAFRLRHLIGEDLAHEALRRYLRNRPKPARMSELARALRVSAPLTGAMRILQG